jgi:uncharacterized SAM-binding protein YcdF (DUF218 family)
MTRGSVCAIGKVEDRECFERVAVEPLWCEIAGDGAGFVVTHPGSMSARRRILVALEVVFVVVGIVLVDLGISGYVVFTRATVDQLRPADAIIVLGGEHDGREDYGLSLARAGLAKTVVISNPNDPRDRVMKRVCSASGGGIEVICRRPDPPTTRGEADMMRRLARERSWTKIIVISWRYHLPRARLIFHQCFSDAPAATVMVPVPRRYRYSPLDWEFVYAYQWGALAKAVVQGECDASA